MKTNKKLLSSFLVLILTFCLVSVCACSRQNEQTPSDNDSVITGTESEQIPNPDDSTEKDNTDIDTTDKTEDDKSSEDAEQDTEEILYKNPLTGLPCDESFVTKRPVAMMINNIKQAIPQLGIENADIMYECIVEGGITRLMCVFSDYESLPVTGSVRSSRDYYIDLAQSHDAIYAHCGGSEDAYSTISARNIDNVDGVRGSQYEANAYWKDQDRVRSMGYEHASMTSGEKLAKAIADLGFRTTLTDGFSHPLSFYETETPFEGDDAISVSISYSGNYSKAFFEFDEEAGCYKKGQYGQAHIDSNSGKPLTFENIIILGVSYQNTFDSYNHLVMSFEGEGQGYYVSNGKIKNIDWKKTDRQLPYSLYEQDGTTPLLINPGKSYIGLSNGLGQVKYSATADFIIE